MLFLLCVIKSRKSNKATIQRKCFASWQKQKGERETKWQRVRENWNAGQWRCISVSATTARGKWCKRNNFFLFYHSQLLPAWLKPLFFCPVQSCPCHPACPWCCQKASSETEGQRERVVSTCPHDATMEDCDVWYLSWKCTNKKKKENESVKATTNWTTGQF